MLTRFGKQLRKIRIESDQRLKDMADKLGVTVAYLSAVENGNRKVPDAWIPIIATEYCLDEHEEIELQQAAYENKKEIRISLEDNVKADLALSFARKFKNMTNDDLDKLQEFLDTL
jgi:transcriptional regulator with XRE-family HTH domain